MSPLVASFVCSSVEAFACVVRLMLVLCVIVRLRVNICDVFMSSVCTCTTLVFEILICFYSLIKNSFWFFKNNLLERLIRVLLQHAAPPTPTATTTIGGGTVSPFDGGPSNHTC